MQQVQVERIVRRGGMVLAEALDHYWPTNGDNEVAERNVTLALARAFGDAGFLMYAEGHSGDDRTKRIDLLALNFDRSVEVVIEAKRLYNSSQVALMHADVDRIASFRLQADSMLRDEPPRHRFGLVVGTTWLEEYAQWFSREDAPHPAGGAWEAFASDPRLGTARWGSVVLRGYDQRRGPTNFHHFVYCLFALSPQP